MTFRLRHLIAALMLHALLFGLLISGVQCTRKPVRPPVIQAVLLDPNRQEVAQQKRQDEQRKLEEKKRLDEQRKLEEKQRREDEARRLAEEQKRKAAAEQQRQKLEETKRQKELAEKKKAEEQARKKQEQEEQRERADAAKREIQEKTRMEEQLRQEALRREVEREQQARASAERESMQSEWADVLGRHVQKYWNRPAAAPAAFDCTVRVQLLPDGTVTSAKIMKSCGTAPLDKSVEDAVLRSSPMPRPANPLAFDRDLIINFFPGP
jgi:colicin import membrane protein